jgi:hypothetical protein
LIGRSVVRRINRRGLAALTVRSALCALVVGLVFVAHASAAGTSSFKLTSKGGKTESFSLIGYDFLSGHGKVGASGKVEVDLSITSKAQRAALKKGPFKAARLHVVYNSGLGPIVNKIYKFGTAKITRVLFVTGAAGPTAVVYVSFKKLTT